MRRGLRARLAELRRSLFPFAGLGAGAFHAVTIRPSMGFALVPRPFEKPDPAAQLGALVLDRCSGVSLTPEQLEQIRELIGPATAGPAGLVDGAYSDATEENPRQRKGLQGLSAAGKLALEDLCSLVREDRGLYAMWTVTLPPEAAAELDRIDNGAQKWIDTLRRRFGEALARACAKERRETRRHVRPIWAFVVEPQSSGRPHLHFVFRCKGRQGRPFFLNRCRLDRLIGRSIAAVTGLEVSTEAAGKVHRLRKDPGSYLSKYLSKGGQQNGAEAITRNGWSLNLVPFHWWGMSQDARALVEQHRFELPSVFVGWLSRQWGGLAAMGLLEARIWQPEAEGAPAIVCGRFAGIDQLEWLIGHLAQLAESAVTSGRTYGYT